jgi:hypothetical protein
VSDPSGDLSDAEKLAAMERLVRLYNEEGDEGWLKGATDDVVLVSAPEWPGGGTYEGAEAASVFLREFSEAWASVRFEYFDPEIFGPRVFAPSRWVVEGHASGAPSTVDFWSVTTLRGDLVCRFDAFFNREDALDFARTGERTGDP